MSKYYVEKVGMGSVMVIGIFRGFCKHKDKSLNAQWTHSVSPSFKVIGWFPRVCPRKPEKNMVLRIHLAPNAREQGSVWEVMGQISQQSLC